MLSLSINSIKGLNGTYRINIGNSAKKIKISDESVVIFRLDKADIENIPIEIKEQEIYITKQTTGFGEKSFFNCPICGERRVKLYKTLSTNWFRCRSCLDENIYKERCNVYDSGGTGIIDYKFKNLIVKLDLKKSYTTKHIPFDCRLYWNCRPPYMRYDEFELILKQLCALSAMRDTTILQKARYNTKDINRILNSDKLKNIAFIEIFDAIWKHKI